MRVGRICAIFLYMILAGGSLVWYWDLGRVIVGAVGGISWKGTEIEKEGRRRGEGGSGKVVL